MTVTVITGSFKLNYSTKITTSLICRSDHMEKGMTWALNMWPSLITLMSVVRIIFKAIAL